MNTLFVVSLVIIVVLVGIMFFLKRRKGRLVLESKNELKLENVEIGGVVHLSFVGEDMEDYDLVVSNKHTYRSGDFSWYELVGDNGKQQVNLSFEINDELEVSLTMNKVRLSDLQISRKDLERFDEDESGMFIYNGMTFHYEDSDDAEFYRDGDISKGEKYYYWDFESDDGKHLISIEEWSDGSLEAAYSIVVEPSNVTVYSLRN